MFFEKDRKPEASGKSDFHEFWKVLEDLEENGDHVAIGIIWYFNRIFVKWTKFSDSSVTQQCKKIKHNENHEDNFYYDITGDTYCDLSSGFLSKAEDPVHKKGKKCSDTQHKENSPARINTSDSYSETTSDIQKITKRKKPICISYKYNDNYENYIELANKLKKKLKQKSCRKADQTKSKLLNLIFDLLKIFSLTESS